MPCHTGKQASRTAGGSAIVTITASTLSSEQSDRLAELQRSAQELLAGLDELGLSLAAAYTSMALDVMGQSGCDLQDPEPVPNG